MTSQLENLAGPRGSLTAQAYDTNEFIGLRDSGLIRFVTDLVTAAQAVADAVEQLDPS